MTGHHGILAIVAGSFSLLVDASSAQADSMSDALDLAPPGEPMSVCTASFTLGSPSSCKPEELWLTYAQADCAERGYPTIGAISYTKTCWKGFRSVDYTCCN